MNKKLALDAIMRGMMKIAINICLSCLFLAGCAKEPDAVPKPDMVKEGFVK